MRLGLIGARIAPLGFFNTDTANGGSMYVDQIMVAVGALYVRLRGITSVSWSGCPCRPPRCSMAKTP